MCVGDGRRGVSDCQRITRHEMMRRHACSARAYPKISAVMSIKNESRSIVLHMQTTPSTAARVQWRRSCAARALGEAVVDMLDDSDGEAEGDLLMRKAAAGKKKAKTRML